MARVVLDSDDNSNSGDGCGDYSYDDEDRGGEDEGEEEEAEEESDVNEEDVDFHTALMRELDSDPEDSELSMISVFVRLFLLSNLLVSQNC